MNTSFIDALVSGGRDIQCAPVLVSYGCQQIPMDVINKTTTMSPPTSKKEAQAFLGFLENAHSKLPSNCKLPLSTDLEEQFQIGP